MTTQALTIANPATLAPMATVTAADVEDLARHKRAANTLRSYAATRREFDTWLSQAGHPAGEAPTVAHVAGYLIALDKAGAKTATIVAKRAGLVYHYGDVARAEAVADTLGAIRRRRADRLADDGAVGVRGNASQGKAALSEDQLRAMCANRPEGLGAIRDRALLLLGYFGAFRRSELVALNVEDLTYTAGGLVVRIARSKTDQLGAGATKPIAANRDRRIDPVAAVQAWQAASGIKAGALFRGVRQGRLLPKRLTAQVVALVVKREAGRVGLNPDVFGAHSLRSGFVTTARRRGVADRTTRAVTGHRTNYMIDHYDQRDTREALAELAGVFA